MSARSVLRVECASDAYKMDLSANIDQNGTAFSGNWFASQYRQGPKYQGKTSRVLSRRSRERYDRRLADSSRKRKPPSFVMEAPGARVSIDRSVKVATQAAGLPADSP